MCLLIIKRPDATIPDDHLKNGYEANPHGAGYAYIKDGRVKIKRGFTSFESFLQSYRTADPKVTHLIHFRWATHGPKTAENCHPFRLPHGCAMGHNGIIDVPTFGDESDTRAFINGTIAPDMSELGLDILLEPLYQEHIESQIGGSKLAFLRPDGSFTIYNEKFGHWKDDVWYSTTAYQKKTYTYSGTGYGTGEYAGRRGKWDGYGSKSSGGSYGGKLSDWEWDFENETYVQVDRITGKKITVEQAVRESYGDVLRQEKVKKGAVHRGYVFSDEEDESEEATILREVDRDELAKEAIAEHEADLLLMADMERQANEGGATVTPDVRMGFKELRERMNHLNAAVDTSELGTTLATAKPKVYVPKRTSTDARKWFAPAPIANTQANNQIGTPAVGGTPIVAGKTDGIQSTMSQRGLEIYERIKAAEKAGPSEYDEIGTPKAGDAEGARIFRSGYRFAMRGGKCIDGAHQWFLKGYTFGCKRIELQMLEDEKKAKGFNPELVEQDDVLETDADVVDIDAMSEEDWAKFKAQEEEAAKREEHESLFDNLPPSTDEDGIIDISSAKKFAEVLETAS